MIEHAARYLRQSTLFALAALSLETCLWGQTNDPKDLLSAVRENVAQTLARLPRYLCSLTIDRSQYPPDRGRSHSCDPLAAERKQGKYKPRPEETDRVRLDVAIGTASEIYSWPGENRFDDRNVFDLVEEGALQNGDFSNILNSIFTGGQADFSYHGETEIDGRMLAEFGFEVPRDQSEYVFSTRRMRVLTGFSGTFLADPKTGDLVRLLIHTEDLPVKTGACQATTALDYNRMHLNDSDFLLPREADLDILSADGSELRNRTVFSACHEFRGQSAIRFDDPSEDTGAAKKTPRTTVAPQPPLPAGIGFQVRFTDPIDPAAASAGDRIRGVLGSPVRDPVSKAILVPQGAEVMARIVRFERFSGSPPSVRMLVKLETVNRNGNPAPLRATKKNGSGNIVDASDREASVGAEATTVTALNATRVVQRRVSATGAGTPPDPTVGVFEFHNVSPNSAIGGGLESQWITAGP